MVRQGARRPACATNVRCGFRAPLSEGTVSRNKKILVTGGAGFIGSHFVDLLVERGQDEVICLDAFTYAADPRNLDKSRGRIRVVKGDIRNPDHLRPIFEDGVDWVVNFAAETHVDNSIVAPLVFAETNVLGTLRLLMFSLEYGVGKFLQVSTDEVYGSRKSGAFQEGDPHEPSSPYAASKSGAEQFVCAYGVTYGVPVLVTRSTNNYGPRQHKEKFIPTCIACATEGRPIPVYGAGQNQRDWLHVQDNARAIDLVFREGQIGQVYNIGAGNHLPNVELARKILRLCSAAEDGIEFVEDRKGHDFRYAVDSAKVRALGWDTAVDLEEGLEGTVAWYRERSKAPS